MDVAGHFARVHAWPITASSRARDAGKLRGIFALWQHVLRPA
jgi:hypothetical protein